MYNQADCGAVVDLPCFSIEPPYLLFAGDQTMTANAKTGFGLVDWARERCLGQLRLAADAVDFGLPDLTLKEAAASGVKTMIVGIAPDGGRASDEWRVVFRAALEAGLDLASGLHDRLNSDPALRAIAARNGGRLIDVRTPPHNLPVGTGAPRPGRRVLTVGTDCAVGKKYMALALARELSSRGADAKFRATGQTGIMIAGEGIPIDSVVCDFVSGAAELLSPAASPSHWDVIEGQGSLFHPSYAAVTLGLLHGSQPEAIVLCHDPSRRCIDGHVDYQIPSLIDACETYLAAARLTSPLVRLAGISLNTKAYSSADALTILNEAEAQSGFACVDPLRTGVAAIADGLLA